MVTTLDTKIKKEEKSNPVSPRNENHNYNAMRKHYPNNNLNIWTRVRYIAPKELEGKPLSKEFLDSLPNCSHIAISLEGQKLPQELLDFISGISPKLYEKVTIENAMQRLDNIEKAEKSKAKLKINTKKTEPFLNNNNLDGMVESYYNNFYKENVLFTNNGVTLAEPDNLMAHCTIAGANLFNNLDEKVKGVYNKANEKITDKISNLSPKAKRAIRAGIYLLFGAPALLSYAGCTNTVTPPTPPTEHGDIADSHKVTAIVPYYETEPEGKEHYCLISRGVIVTNYEANYGVENPQKVLTQQELADAIFGTVGATMEDLVSYINGRTDLNLQVEIQYLSILEIQRMLEDDIVPIVLTKSGTDAYLPVGYDKLKEEVTMYATLSGKEVTGSQFVAFNLDNNKSVVIINKSKLSTYLENLL